MEMKKTKISGKIVNGTKRLLHKIKAFGLGRYIHIKTYLLKLTKNINIAFKHARRKKMENLIIKGTLAFLDTIKAGTPLKTQSQANEWFANYAKQGIETLFMLTKNSKGDDVYYRISKGKTIAPITYDAFKVDFLDVPDPRLNDELFADTEAQEELPVIEPVVEQPEEVAEPVVVEQVVEEAPQAEVVEEVVNEKVNIEAIEEKANFNTLKAEMESYINDLTIGTEKFIEDTKAEIDKAVKEAVKTALADILAKL
jgi:hypothetical protein